MAEVRPDPLDFDFPPVPEPFPPVFDDVAAPFSSALDELVVASGLPFPSFFESDEAPPPDDDDPPFDDEALRAESPDDEASEALDRVEGRSFSFSVG